MNRVCVAVCATDALTRSGVLALLSASDNVEVVCGDETSTATVVVVAAEHVSEEVLQSARSRPGASDAVLVLLVNRVPESVLATAVACGVVAVVPRTTVTVERLVHSVLAADRGPRRPPADVLGSLRGQLESLQRELTPMSLALQVEPREIELLKLLAAGWETAEIADRLSYSERNVKNIVHRLLRRWDLRNRTHAVAYALRNGII